MRATIKTAALTLALCLGFPLAAISQQNFGITTQFGLSLSVTTSSANVQLGASGNTAVVYNTGSNAAFLKIGAASSQAASTSDAFLPAGAAITLSVPPSGYLAAITSSSTTTLRIVQGSGSTAIAVPGAGGGGGGGAVTVADGADVAQGTTTDTAYAGSGSSTVIAGLKGIYNALAAALPAGANIIGKVGIDQTTPGTTNGVVASGNAASGAADSGNPVKVGCKYNATLPTLTDGQRGDCQMGSSGRILIGMGTTASAVDAQSNSVVGYSGGNETNSALRLGAVGTWKLSGTVWDRDFTCPSSAVVNVTAGNTTELVALTASQVIRVCSIAISSSLTGTATFVYGTGTNCGTGTTSLSGAMSLTTGTPLAISSGNGSLLRSATANAICLTAATGNITGFITYAKY